MDNGSHKTVSGKKIIIKYKEVKNMNFFSKKFQKIVAGVVVAALVVSMLIGVVGSFGVI